MAMKHINVGTAPLAGDGEPIRDALIKVNENFDEVFISIQDVYNLINNLDISDLTDNLGLLDISLDGGGAALESVVDGGGADAVITTEESIDGGSA